MKRVSSRGFTIVEMMIATAVFAVILLIITAGVMAFSKQYMRGQTSSNLQFTARQVSAQVGQDIQFGNGVDAAGPTQVITDLKYQVGCYRIGSNMYLYQIGSLVEGGNHALILVPNKSTSCSSVILGATTLKDALAAGGGAREMLSQGQRLLNFTISTGSPTHSVAIGLASGANDLFNPEITPTTTAWASLKCKAGAGQEYCAVITLRTVAVERV